MKIFTVATLLFLSVCCFAQAPKATIYSPNTDLYVGYLVTYPDYGLNFNSYQFNGAEVAFTKSLRSHLSITAAGDFSTGTVYNTKQFSGTIGPKVNLLTGRFRPYITVQGGFAYQTSNGMYAFDHHPPLVPGTTDTESGFTYRYGGGADFQLTRKVYWRVLQWDIQPQPWARHTPWYQNAGSGLGYVF
jgi:hypothetical protein